jgi:hypothetical protein
MKRNHLILLAVLILIVVIGAGFVYLSSGDEYPRDSISCIVKGGHWEGGRCYDLPTSDGGKVCDDDDDCQGRCVIFPTDEDWEKFENNEVVYITGECSNYQPVLGCYPMIEEGKLAGAICAD